MAETIVRSKPSPFPEIDEVEERIFEEAEDEELHPVPSSVRAIRSYIMVDRGKPSLGQAGPTSSL